MKPIRRSLSVAVIVCLLAFGLGHVSLRAAGDDDAAHKAAAEDVLKAMHMESIFDTTANMMTTQVLDRITNQAAGQLTDKAAAADFQKRMHTETHEMFAKQFNWALLKPEFIQTYTDLFNTQELKDLASFYSSPTGQKLVTKQPELSQRFNKASQDRAGQVLPLIIKMIRDESAKIQGPVPPGAPGMVPPMMAPPGASGGPGVPPAPPAGFTPPPPPPMNFVPPPPPAGMTPPAAPSAAH